MHTRETSFLGLHYQMVFAVNMNIILNMKVMFAVMNTSKAEVKIRPEKNFRPVWDLNPWPLQYQCSVLPNEPTSQLGATHYVCFPINQGIDESRTVNI